MLDAKLFEKYKLAAQLTTKAVHASERGDLLTEVLNIINSERVGTKYKPATIRFIGIKMAHIPTKDLYAVISMGKDYKNRHGSFSKYLFGSLKVKQT